MTNRAFMTSPHTTFKWRKPYSLFLVLALFLALVPGTSLMQETNSSVLGPLTANQPGVNRIQPALVELASQQPDKIVSVIVQKRGSSNEAEAAVTRLTGKITDDLHIINAFVAELPAGTVLELVKVQTVRAVSLDAPVIKSASSTPIDITNLKNTYIKAINADDVWNDVNTPYQGNDMGIAVVDSGINPDQNFYTEMGRSRLVASVAFNNGYNKTVYDGYGHGTHVAGIIASNGSKVHIDKYGKSVRGDYIGVAPMANLINVKVSDDAGAATASNVVKGLQWVNENRQRYNIRVVNLSINSSLPESYHTNPISAAAEILWFNGVVVVVSAGNSGIRGVLPPANDPFVITVGATDDKGTDSILDDTIAPFSAYGISTDGVAKPDLVAPGTNIVSMLSMPNNKLARDHPANMVDQSYFRMSGTSMSAPMVAATAALVLQANPKLTPDQVKYRLKATAQRFDIPLRAGAGYLDALAAVKGKTTQAANTGLQASKLLWTGAVPITWGSVNWDSVNWDSVNWDSVNWDSVNWDSVNWDSDYWGGN